MDRSLRLSTLPALRICLLLASGIALSYCLPAAGTARASLFLLSAGSVWVGAELLHRRRPGPIIHNITLLAYLILLLLLGFLRVEMSEERLERERRHAGLLELADDVTVIVRGRVNRVRRADGSREFVDLATDRILVGEKVWNRSFRFRLYTDREGSLPEGVARGDQLVGEIRTYRLAGPSNPGEFDFRKLLDRQRIALQGEFERTPELRKRRGKIHDRLREVVEERIVRRFDEQSALAGALLTGNREAISPETASSFSRAGLSHVMAVSGLHVGFLVAPIWFMTTFLQGLGRVRWIGLGVLSVVLPLYALLAEFSPSVCRASLMAWLLFCSRMISREVDPLNVMGASALLLLLIDPAQLQDPGFQMSYTAVSLILLLFPVFNSLMPKKQRRTLHGRVYALLSVSVIAQAGLFPILGYYFGEFSLIGPLANLLTVPLLSLVIPASLVILSIPDRFESAVPFLNRINLTALGWTSEVAESLGSLEWSWIPVRVQFSSVFPAWTILTAWAAFASRPVARYRVTLLAAVWLACIALHLTFRMSAGELVVTVLDVGQGDAIHIRTPQGRHILVDTGRWTPFGDSAEGVLIPYFRHLGVDRLDAVILTHPHSDHIGGVPTLLREMEIAVIFHCGTPHDSNIYRRYTEMASERDIARHSVTAGDRIDLDPAIRIFVLGPEEDLPITEPNNRSVVFKLVYGQTHLLFTGDAERLQEWRLTERYGDFLASDFLKAGHHGSRTSSGDAFLAEVQPGITVVSNGFRNRFGHPHPEAVERLRRKGSRLYFTALQGGLEFRSDGNRIAGSPARQPGLNERVRRINLTKME